MISPTLWLLAILLVIAENTLYFRAWPRGDVASRIAVAALVLAVRIRDRRYVGAHLRR